MMYALVKFKFYLLGSKPFEIYYDHASLRTATQSPHIAEKIACWISYFLIQTLRWSTFRASRMIWMMRYLAGQILILLM